MINAQSVLAQLVTLGALPSHDTASPNITEASWLQRQMEQTKLQHRQDNAGNHWITLPGAKEQSVVLGSYLQPPGRHMLDSQLGLVAGLEILKAVERRGGPQPACTLHCVIWAEPLDAHGRGQAATTALLAAKAAAYLELHVEPAGSAQAATPLGVVTSDQAGNSPAFNPRLMALCDEAVRELTGASASSSSTTANAAAEIARAGLPTAVMSVRVPDATIELQTIAGSSRLHLLEAAEAFGRWAESTIHLVAGEEVDLWAREHRMPHSELT